MVFKRLGWLLLLVASLSLPSTLSASDFEWRLTLNLRAQSDPYGYRYGLMSRFAISEPEVMMVLDRVYEPADAYMIFRLAELSGHSSQYVLRLYHERRHYGWQDIAYMLGIRPDRHEFIILREYHDMKEVYYDYNFRRKERYEERYRVPMPHYHVPAPKHYTPPPKRQHLKPEHYHSPYREHSKSAPMYKERREAYTSNTYRAIPKKDVHHHKPTPHHQDTQEPQRRHQ